MHYIFLLMFCIFMASGLSAFAQDDVIRVVGEDGSVQEIEVAPAPGSKTNNKVQEAVNPGPSEPTITEMPPIRTQMPAQLEAIVKPLTHDSTPELHDELSDDEAEDISMTPSIAPDEKEVEEKYDEQAGAKSSGDDIEEIIWNQSERVVDLMIKPPRKPDISERAFPTPQYKPEVSGVPTGPITRQQAIDVALERAPPANSFFAISDVVDQRPVFVVRFRTDNGPIEIIVDQGTGEIVE